jgi:hypothetical protein
VEFKAIAEIFFGSRVLCQHKGPAFRTSRSDAVADAAWQAIKSWDCSNKGRLQNSIHYLLYYRKKDRFNAYGVKRDIPKMEMVHHQDVTVELSSHLLAAQREIETLRIQLRNADATISGQRPLFVRHRHLDCHLLSLEFKQGARSEQPLPLQIPQSLGVT